MENTPLVSVILPTYNRAEFLPRAINSVLAQTYPWWELIIWDDGSTDNTEEIVRAYTDERVRYFTDKNRGMSFALNNAIKQARGEYIAFLDDDDQWTAHKLSFQIDILINNLKIDLVFGNFLNTILETGENGIGFEQYFTAMKELKGEKNDNDIFVITDNFFKSICINNFIAFDTVVARRDIINKGGLFNEKLRNGQDFEYWWRIALIGGVFAYTNEIVLKRIKYPGSLSSPSVLSCESSMKGTDLCLQAALSNGRGDLVPYLNRRYRNIWSNMIILLGNLGDGKGMLNSFLQSIKYGINLGSIRLFVEAVWAYLINLLSKQ